MSNKAVNKVVLPCNGLDKSFGVIAGKVAVNLIETDNSLKLICPVLLNSEPVKYEKLLSNSEIYVINGCMTRCASKLLENLKIPIRQQIFIPDMIKKYGIKPGTKLTLDDNSLKLCNKITEGMLESIKLETNQIKIQDSKNLTQDTGPIVEEGFFQTQKDKFTFNVPKANFYFNENDCWVKPENDIAYLGISDFVQNNVGDIIYVELPKIGSKIGQFDEVGSFESVKTVVQLISPVSGEIIGVNTLLTANPELLNNDPYQKGWVAKIKMENWSEDKEILMNNSQYFDYLKKKVETESNKRK